MAQHNYEKKQRMSERISFAFSHKMNDRQFIKWKHFHSAFKWKSIFHERKVVYREMTNDKIIAAQKCLNSSNSSLSFVWFGVTDTSEQTIINERPKFKWPQLRPTKSSHSIAQFDLIEMQKKWKKKKWSEKRAWNLYNTILMHFKSYLIHFFVDDTSLRQSHWNVANKKRKNRQSIVYIDIWN